MGNLKADLKKLGKTPQAQSWEKFEKGVAASPAGKAMEAEVKKAKADTEASIEKRPNGFHIDNAKLPGLHKEWKGVKAKAEAMKNGPIGKEWMAHAKETFATPAGKQLIADAKKYKEGPEGKALKAEVEKLKADIKANVKVTGKPAHRGPKKFGPK